MMTTESKDLLFIFQKLRELRDDVIDDVCTDDNDGSCG